MNLTLFARNRETKDGKKYVEFSTHIQRRDGTEQFAIVKFNQGTAMPKKEDCPLNVVVEKEDASLSKKAWVSEDGTKKGVNYTLWVSNWKVDVANPFRDTSLDEFC